ncbi:Ankyrin repeats (3 copies) [compost metagenome]
MTNSEIIKTICAHNPAWEKSWKTSGLEYPVIAEIGTELVRNVAKEKHLGRVCAVFEDIEKMLGSLSGKKHIEGRSLIGAGMFEAMQNTALSEFKSKQMDAMDDFFGPVSLKLWQDLIEGWYGKGIRSLTQLDRRLRKSKYIHLGDFQIPGSYFDELKDYLWKKEIDFDSDMNPENRDEYVFKYNLTNRENNYFVRINWTESGYQVETSTPKLMKRTRQFLENAYEQARKDSKDQELIYHAFRGDLEKVKSYCRKDSEFQVPMVLAAREGELEVFRFLLKKQKMKRRELSKTLSDALVAACGPGYNRREKLEVIRFIRKKRAKIGRKQWKIALADALIEACSYGNNLETVKLLLKGRKKIPYHPDDQYRTPFHSAARSGDIELMKELLQLPNCRRAWNFVHYYSTPNEVAYASDQLEMKTFLDQVWMEWYGQGD